jgi:predicted ferric reductase
VTAFAASLGPSVYWYLTRGTGMVSLLLLTAIIVLGILGPLRVSLAPRWPRFAVDVLHRDLSLLALVVIALHVITTVLDGFAPIGLTDGVVPFASPYRPLWLGLGAIAFDLMIALVLTSLVRRRLGYLAWRSVHWLAYASWPVAVLHGLGTGTDASQAWSIVITFGCVVLVALASLARVVRADGLTEGTRATGIAVAVVIPVALAVFALEGPLSPKWARRAGTPASLFAPKSSQRASR